MTQKNNRKVFVLWELSEEHAVMGVFATEKRAKEHLVQYLADISGEDPVGETVDAQLAGFYRKNPWTYYYNLCDFEVQE